MNGKKIIEKLVKNGITSEELIHEVKNDFNLISDVIQGLCLDKARIKYGCAKTLSKISEDFPEKLYDKFEFFIDLIDHKNNILK